MTDHADKSQNTQAQDAAASPSRRQLLRFGVAAAPLVLTVRAAHATQVVNSVSNCFVPVPQIVDGAGNPKYLPGQVRKNPSFNVKANGGPYNPPSPLPAAQPTATMASRFCRWRTTAAARPTRART
ncbi:hypothetical protein E6W36_06095 [Hankyongella ginsenosidimutans]|uniref:Uncharacterized protein n=1 Tax=Hankyongella ginsenosidimutans TaxID=1763828 RepID=A0A4D7C6C4_9SPHN|nr:hypothetical protein [Hankyongella ginsenosidimutans]QCI79285.1 hypothetical protein E6W36_06095 [Hankyongella ginsenosidimutans]